MSALLPILFPGVPNDNNQDCSGRNAAGLAYERPSGVVMEFFDIRKMPISLWRNGAGETREICCFPSATRDFSWRASIASIASNGEFSSFPGVDRVITLLEGGEVTLDAGKAFCHTLKHHQPYSFAGDLPVKALLTDGQMSMDFNIMTRREQCRAKVRGGVIFVLSGAWQLGEKLLRADQGACWENGSHTLRLLETKGTLLFSEITWLPGH